MTGAANGPDSFQLVPSFASANDSAGASGRVISTPVSRSSGTAHTWSGSSFSAPDASASVVAVGSANTAPPSSRANTSGLPGRGPPTSSLYVRPELNASAAVSFGLSRPNAAGFVPSATNSVASSPDTCVSRVAVFCGSASDATGAASFHTSRPSSVLSCLSANPLAPSTVTAVSLTFGSAVSNSLRLRYATGSRRKVGSRRFGNSFSVSQPGAGGPPMRSLTSATRGHPASDA